jgi:C1A family cysteine protease
MKHILCSTSSIISPVDNRDWVLEKITNFKGVLPLKLDYRNLLKPIRDQGNYGTCAAMVAACIKEYQERKQKNYLFKDNYMSPLFVYFNRINKDSEGMYGRDVMNILHKLGTCQEKILPYSKYNNTTITQKSLIEAKQFKIKGYSSITTIKGLKTALYLYGPCYISFPVYNTGTQMWISSSIDDEPLGGHAMTVVGYTNIAFIIRNSWGSSWGDKGYCYYYFKDFGCHYEIYTLVDEITSSKAKQSKKLVISSKNDMDIFNKRIKIKQLRNARK